MSTAMRFAVLVIAVMVILWPFTIAIPIAVIAVWVSLSLFSRAHALRMQRKSRGMPPMRVDRADSQSDFRRPN